MKLMKLNKVSIKKDNACFYRTISYFLYYYTNTINYKSILSKGDKNIWITTNNKLIPEKIYNENNMPELLQRTLINWICNNSENIIEELNYKIFDLLLDTHYPEFIQQYNTDKRLVKKKILKLYKDRYNIFAADNMCNDRWGGTLEMYAVSKLFNVCVEVYEKKNRNKLELIQKWGDKNKPRFRLLYGNNHYDCLLTHK